MDAGRLGLRHCFDGRPFAFERFGAFVAGLEIDAAGLHLGMKTHHGTEALAVLATQITEKLAPRTDRTETLGIFFDAFDAMAQICGDIVDLGDGTLEPSGQISERPSRRHERQGHTQRVACTLVTCEEFDHRLGRFSVGNYIGEDRLFLFEFVVFVFVGDCGPIELIELVAHKVELSRAGAAIAPKRSQRRLDFPGFRPGGEEGRDVNAPESVEGLALRRRP
jgi:hypothetical protein